MKHQILVLALLTGLLFSCIQDKKATLFAPLTPINYKTKLDSLFTSYDTSNAFMGSIAITHRGKTIYTNAVGFSDLSTKTLIDNDTKYRIGSVSKIYTAALVFMAIEDGKLSLAQTISPFFSDIAQAHKITIAQLLQHRSGIHNFTKDKDFFNYHTQYKSPEAMLTMISNYESEFEPNTKGDYSNSNYFLLAQILEHIYEIPYNTLLSTKILEPLKLTNTYTGTTMRLANHESFSYNYTTAWEQLPETNMSITLGAGSIVSNPSEVNTFLEALFAGKIVSMQSLEYMKTIIDSYGMGLARYKINDRQGFGHRGTLDGYKTTAIYFPNEKLAITMASNATKNNNINAIYTEVLKIYHKDPVLDISADEVSTYAGIYVSPKDKDSLVFISNKNVLVLVIKNEFKEPLIYKGNHRFVFEQLYAESRSHTFAPNGSKLTLEQGDYKGIYIKQ